VPDCEGFKPIAVTGPARHPALFALRCVIDVQLATIARPLRPAIRSLRGKVLDVGAGQSPWRDWLPPGAAYHGIDVGHADEFGMMGEQPDVEYYDGYIMPLPNDDFDAALCIEVLEHAPDPSLLLAEVARVLRPGGTLILTVPWSARRHHIPHDYHRFTRERLAVLLVRAGFANIVIRERGNDVAAIANKMIVLCMRLVRPRPLRRVVWTWPLLALAGPVAAAFLVAAHCSLALRLGSRDDPLGYFVTAERTRPPFEPGEPDVR
jgi:SAM-dependent methyltransferase